MEINRFNRVKPLFLGIIIFLGCFYSLPGRAEAKTVKQYNDEIGTKTKNLEDLKRTLEDKKREKKKIEDEEKKIKIELKKIQTKLANNQREKEKLRKNIIDATKKLKRSETELQAAGWEKKQWTEIYDSEADSINRLYHSYYRLFEGSFSEALRLKSLDKKKEYIEQAAERENSSRRAMNSWVEAKNRLTALKAKKEAIAADFTGIQKEKKELLNTTAGRRIVAEDEIKTLTETAAALEDLIGRLETDKRKSESTRPAGVAQRIRKQLPWPVSGKVITTFGKNKHPELDTFVISNGIRIQTTNGAVIKSVGKGEVAFAGEFRSYGLMVVIDHDGKFYSIYGHLGEITVEEGQKINTGEILGKLSESGEAVLYFEIRFEGKAEDPDAWLIQPSQ
jgi:murein hydrolase activator